MPTHYSGQTEEIRALDAFIKLTHAVDSLGARLFRGDWLDGLTPTQFGVLETLYHLGEMDQTEIGTKLLRSSGNITLVIDNLEKRGLVRRERDTRDRRRALVSLTPSGRELIARVFPRHAAAIVREMGVLTGEEQEKIGELCRKLGKREK